MFEVILNFILTSIFLQVAATAITNPTLPPNALPLAQTKAIAPVPVMSTTTDSLGVLVTAQSCIVVEPESGVVLYEKNAQEPRSIASITKLMTALVFLDSNKNWDETITMVAGDYKPGSQPVLLLGDKVTVKDLFYAMMVASSNEAASALARSTGLSADDFAYQMNLRAKVLGMNNSNFVEPIGLSSGNQASAEDVIKLIQVAFSHSEVRKAGATKAYTIHVINKDVDRNLTSTDKALKEDFGIANNSFKIEMGKTGYIDAAGYCFASQVKDENNRRLLIAVLGSSSTFDRFTDTKSLAYWVFSNYRW